MKVFGFERGVWDSGRRAFTLIEIMMVVAIIGIVMAAGIPSLYSAMRKEGMRKAVSDVVSACEKARAQAIMSGTTAEVHFRPQEGTISVGAASAAADSNAGDVGDNPAPTRSSAGFSAKLPDNVAFEMLDVNMMEFNAAEEASVKFYPNGTCDELVVVLVSDKNERSAVTLEITTGLTSVYDDPRKLLMR
jgi:prepilin-type N-terminal cleavage/methylation domain-containing protein